MLAVEQIRKSFEGLKALDNIDIKLKEGGVTGIIGPNGSGKSTLFDIISGFQQADGGTVRYFGERIDRYKPHVIAQKGLVRTFQLPEGGESLTALEHLLTSPRDQREFDLLGSVLNIRGLLRRETSNLAQAKKVLDILDLTRVANERVSNVSGGQRKLVDLGRIFMSRPRFALLDEPTAGVNPGLIDIVLEALQRLNQEGVTLIVVEHNMKVVSRVCDYVFVLDAGRVIAQGTPYEVQNDKKVLDVYLGRDRERGAEG